MNIIHTSIIINIINTITTINTINVIAYCLLPISYCLLPIAPPAVTKRRVSGAVRCRTLRQPSRAPVSTATKVTKASGNHAGLGKRQYQY